jgi:hypothetical protein
MSGNTGNNADPNSGNGSMSPAGTGILVTVNLVSLAAAVGRATGSNPIQFGIKLN